MIATARDWLPMHAYALLAGCLLALVGPLPRRWWLVPTGAVGIAALVRVAPSFDRIYVYGPLLATPAAVLLVAGAVQGNRVLELGGLRFAGRISYALYLWHVPLFRLTGTTYGRSAALPVIAVAVGAAVLSTFLLEEPLRRAWRRRQATGLGVRDAWARSRNKSALRAGCAHVSRLFEPLTLRGTTFRNRVWVSPDVPVLLGRRPTLRLAPGPPRRLRPRRCRRW